MSDPKYKGIEDLVSLVADVALAIIKAPKPLQVAELGLLLPLLPEMELAMSELGEIPSEIGSMSYEEGISLIGIIAAKLAVDEPKAVAVIGASLKMIAAGKDLLAAIKG